MPEHVNGYSRIEAGFEEDKESNELMQERGKKAMTQKLVCNGAEEGGNPNFMGLQCYLKTKMGKFKRHYFNVADGMIHFYRRLGDQEGRQQHPLTQCHLRLSKAQKIDSGNGKITVFYPVQADVPPDRTRLLYFDSEESQNEGLHFLLAEQGYES